MLPPLHVFLFFSETHMFFSLTHPKLKLFLVAQDSLCFVVFQDSTNCVKMNGEMSSDRRERVDLVTEIVNNADGAHEFVNEIVRFSAYVS